jgi:hypothetical protein
MDIARVLAAAQVRARSLGALGLARNGVLAGRAADENPDQDCHEQESS